jgi:hypothetical protein
MSFVPPFRTSINIGGRYASHAMASRDRRRHRSRTGTASASRTIGGSSGSAIRLDAPRSASMGGSTRWSQDLGRLRPRTLQHSNGRGRRYITFRVLRSAVYLCSQFDVTRAPWALRRVFSASSTAIWWGNRCGILLTILNAQRFVGSGSDLSLMDSIVNGIARCRVERSWSPPSLRRDTPAMISAWLHRYSRRG